MREQNVDQLECKDPEHCVRCEKSLYGKLFPRHKCTKWHPLQIVPLFVQKHAYNSKYFVKVHKNLQLFLLFTVATKNLQQKYVEKKLNWKIYLKIELFTSKSIVFSFVNCVLWKQKKVITISIFLKYKEKIHDFYIMFVMSRTLFLKSYDLHIKKSIHFSHVGFGGLALKWLKQSTTPNFYHPSMKVVYSG